MSRERLKIGRNLGGGYVCVDCSMGNERVVQ